MLRTMNNTGGFGAFVNVDVQVVETDTNTIKHHIQKHNKATRNLIRGMLRFIEGKFTSTYANSIAEYGDDAKNYIPCYISYGDGGVRFDENGDAVLEPDTDPAEHIPDLTGWNTTVDYRSSSLVREFELLSNNRTLIRKQADTVSDNMVPAGDMDTVVLYCETAPGEVNMDMENSLGDPSPRYITEIGLFSSPNKTKDDLLAYVKLGNYTDDQDVRKTDTLYVRPGDTIIITWFITIVAMSDVSIVDSSEELLEPELGSVDFSIESDENTEVVEE